MEEQAEMGSKSSEPAESSGSNWVLPHDGPHGTQAELATITKASRMTPETLKLLQDFMTKVEEAGDGEGGVMPRGSCGELVDCGAFKHGGGGCDKLKSCYTYGKLK